MKKKNVIIRIPLSADATAAGMLVNEASQFESKLYLNRGTKHINAKSIMGIMSFMASEDVNADIDVNLEADGTDEDAALENFEKALDTI